jgi:hypothetical protein
LTAHFETTILRFMEVANGVSNHLAGPKSGPKLYTVAFATTMSIIQALSINMKYRSTLLCFVTLLLVSSSHIRGDNIYPTLMLQVRDDGKLLDNDSTVELVKRGEKRIYNGVSKRQLVSPTMKRSSKGYYQFSSGAQGCNSFWIIILPKGNATKERARHPVYSFCVSSESTMPDWSDWLLPNYAATGPSHWMILESGNYTNKLPLVTQWPQVRYRMAIMDVSKGFPGVMINAHTNIIKKLDNAQQSPRE